MKKGLIIFFVLSTFVSFGQNFKEGVYRGDKPPFLICYLTITDSLTQVEYFHKKAGIVFAHNKPKQMIHTEKSKRNKPILISQDEMISIYQHKRYLVIKNKELQNVKVYQVSETESDIQSMRNRYKLRQFGFALEEEIKNNEKFNSDQYWKEFHSFNLEDYIGLSKSDFEDILEGVKEKIINNWR